MSDLGKTVRVDFDFLQCTLISTNNNIITFNFVEGRNLKKNGGPTAQCQLGII